LWAFDAAVREGSAKDAARRLGVTPAAVSHQLRAPEEYLGTALFDRLHRELRVTPAGVALATATSPRSRTASFCSKAATVGFPDRP
jgi:LysR family glycine cleavage system transcriptional activator